ncbi:MAG: hypothetical protein QF471_07055 [Phycisphaerales bacterium]|jgi:hypothetical protein|nr:hypothetical protein [Phycisphaerales bacterium]
MRVGPANATVLVNSRSAVRVALADDEPACREDTEWFHASIPAYTSAMNIALAGSRGGTPLAAVAWDQLPPPDDDWIEVHVATCPQTGLSSGFGPLLDALAWLPHIGGHAGLIADVWTDRPDLLSLLTRIGFEPIATASETGRTRIVFRRPAGPQPTTIRSKDALPRPTWSPADADDQTALPASAAPLSPGAAGFWCEHRDALCDLGLPSTLSTTELRTATEHNPSHLFRSHTIGAATAWSLCSRQGEVHDQHVLLIDWPTTVRSSMALRTLRGTITATVAPDADVRCPKSSGVPHHMFAACGLAPCGESPSGRSLRLRRDTTLARHDRGASKRPPMAHDLSTPASLLTTH